MESLCERGEGGEDWGIAGRAEQEAFDLRAGILHVAGVCVLLRLNIPAMHSEHLTVRVILCRKQHKRIGHITTSGRDGQRVALERGRGLCTQGQRLIGIEHEGVRIVRDEIRAVIRLHAARKEYRARGVGADADLRVRGQPFGVDGEQRTAAVGTDAEVAGLAIRGVVFDDGCALDVHHATRFDVDAAAVAGGRVAGDFDAEEVQRAARFDVDRAAVAACDVVAGDLAAVKVPCAVLVNDDRAAILCNAAGDLDVGNVDGCVRYIQAAAVFIVYAGSLEDTGADAVRKGEMPLLLQYQRHHISHTRDRCNLRET